MILKSFLLEKNLSLIDNYNLILFYGENIGLKDEFKIALKKKILPLWTNTIWSRRNNKKWEVVKRSS